MPWPTPACTATRDVMRAVCPLIHRWFQMQLASSCRMAESLWKLTRNEKCRSRSFTDAAR
jgi:hypothetical protein